MLTARTSARYGLRVFGYLLATTLAAGVVAGIGAGGAYALDSAFFTELPPGGQAVDLTALAVFGAGLGVGLLVFAAGLIVTLADAVSAGVRAAEPTVAGASETEPTDPSADAEATGDDGPVPESTAPDDTAPIAEEEPTGNEDALGTPEPDPPVSDESEPVPSVSGESEPDPPVSEESEPGPSVSGESGRRDEEPMDTDPFAEAAESDTYDPTDPIDDPHEAQTNPFGEPEEQPTAEEWTSKAPQGEDDAWREEIEAKLDDEERE